MAYKLKYYKTIDATRLNIYEKDGVATAMEIGKVVQGLALEIQGQQDDIAAPIVKTSLTMTFCDAPDLEEGKKCGHWEEFYTPDSTKWLVELLSINDDGSADVEWQGFITPDSYSDELVYRGSVTVIARDNIGHLSDLDFDVTGNGAGMLTVRELLLAAWAKIEQPMALTFDDRDDAVWLECEGVKIYDMMLNASAFEGKTWGEAVEAVLDSCGLCMRFVGLGKVAVCSVRSLPLLGYSRADAATKRYPTFLTGATRELDPACRRIEEVADYDVESGVSFPGVTGDDFTGEQLECPFDSESVFGEHTTTNIPVWPVANKSDVGWSNPIPAKTLFLNPAAYNTSIGVSKANMFLAANAAEERHVQFGQYVTIQPMSLSMTLGKYAMLYDSNLMWAWHIDGASLTVAVTFDQNDAQYYFNGSSWTTEYTTLTLNRKDDDVVQLDINAVGLSGQGLLRFHILKVTVDWEWDVSDGEGVYVQIIGGITIGYSAAVVSKNTVRTIYDDSNNVIIDKAPELAPAMDDVSLPGIIRNGIFLPSGDTYLAARTWSWDGTGAQQLAVYKHLQLLPYHAKPNNLITGTIVDTTIRRFRTIWLFEDKEHLLLSGQFNVLTGRLENAMLREFARYEDMWGDMTDTASLPDVETSEATTGSGGGSSSGATTTSTTTVYIGGGGSGASNLSELGDVNVEDVEAGSVLMFNGTKWVDAKPAYATAEDLQTISDKIDQLWQLDSEGNVWTDRPVYSTKQIAAGGPGEEGEAASGTVNAIQVGDTLYEPVDGVVTLPEFSQGEGGATALSGLTDVSLSSLANQDVLIYDSASGKWKNVPQSSLVPSLTGYATQAWVQEQGYLTSAALDGYATEEYVTGLGYITASALDTKLSGYLPLTGGTITTATGYGITIDSSYTKGAYNRFYINGVEKATVGYNANLAYIANEATHYRIGVRDDGTPVYRKGPNASNEEYPLIHSGNIGSQSVAYATSAGSASSCTGNAATATKLATARTIWGQSFDGTEDVRGALSQATTGEFSESVRIGNITLSYDSTAGALKIDGNVYATGQIAAGGAGEEGDEGTGSVILDYDSIVDALGYTPADEADLASAVSRILALEGKTTAVSFTQTQTSGTKIGAITIDGTSTNIYAPTIPTLSGGASAESGKYVSGVTVSGHTVTVTKASLPTSLPASDVYAWAKASTKPSYTTKEVTENTNLYFTNARAVAAVLGSSAIGSTSSYIYWTGSAWATKALGTFAFKSSLAFSELTSKPTTIAGYGITDAITTANIGSQSVSIAKRLTSVMTTTAASLDVGQIVYSRFQAAEDVWGVPHGDNANGVLTINTHGGNYYHQLAFTALGWYWRKFSNAALDATTAWRKIAFTDSDITGNAATATKLATARTIWGQSFDGTGDITGNLTLNNNVSILGKDTGGTGRVLMFVNNSNEFIIGNGIAGAGYNMYIEGNSVALTYGTSRTVGMILTSSGNVGIGTTSPSYRLHVAGTLGVGGTATFSSSASIAGSVYSGVGFKTPTADGYYSFGSEIDVYGMKCEQISGNALVQVAGYGGVRIKAGVGYALFPYADNSLTLGTSSYRWSHIYGVNATIATANITTLKIGSATITYDSTAGALKIDGSVYATGQIAAGAVGEAGDVVSATYNVIGGIKPAYSTTGKATLTTAAAAYSNSPTISARTTTAGRYYAVEVDANGRAYVNVPWVAPTTLNSGMTLASVNGATLTLANGVHTVRCTAAISLDFNDIEPADTSASCVVIIQKTGSYTLSVPAYTTSRVRLISGGAAATSSTSVGTYYGLMLVWNTTQNMWDGYKIGG